jgi:PhzF family phenazine biosynthesis protein
MNSLNNTIMKKINSPLPFWTYRVFTDLKNNFFGNTSAVIISEFALEDSLMQRIASDLWQPATTFLFKRDSEWHVRWFAPDEEIGLCGHGSLAAMTHLSQFTNEKIAIKSKGGIITGGKSGEKYFIYLDSIVVKDSITENTILQEALGIPILEHYTTNNKNIVLTDSETSVRTMKPNFQLLKSINYFGYAVTAKGDQCDFVSRTRVPHVNQLEDPATGSSHAALAPFWCKRLNKNKLEANQLSARGGRFEINVNGNEVRLLGAAELIAHGELLP